MVNPLQIAQKFRATLNRFGLFAPGERVLVGVSGGADSTALLHLLATVRAELSLELQVVHFNHGLRGEEAEEDARFVASLAWSLGVSCTVERLDVRARQAQSKLSVQEAARDLRQAALHRIAAEQTAQKIALGHTQSDLVETVLMRIVRGTGIEGLRGFGAADFPTVRPLYEVTREETQAYCKNSGLAFRSDPSNLDLHYSRNRTRLELLPFLEAYYNERAGEAILRMARLADADHSLLDALARERYRLLASSEPGLVKLKSEALRAEPLALQRRIVRQALLEVRGSLKDISAEKIEVLLEAGREGRSLAWPLPSRTGFPKTQVRAGEWIEVSVQPASAPVEAWETELKRGANALPCGGTMYLQCGRGTNGGQAVFFREDDVSLPLTARSWRSGDRLRPRGLEGTKKLQDVFVDAKVPRDLRSLQPVLCEAAPSARILWVPGLAVSEVCVRESEVPQGSSPTRWISLAYETAVE